MTEKQISFFDEEHEADMRMKRSWRTMPLPPAIRGSDTSRAAADAIAPKAGTLHAKVLAFIQLQAEHGATDDEMQVALQMDPSTQRPRRRELEQAGLIRKSTEKRPTRSGREAVVWIAK